MRLSYAGVAALIADMFDVNPAKGVALKGRLKHFQRAGFPPGTNVGRGRVAYGMHQVASLVVAFEMVRMRYTPADAARLVTARWDVIAAALAGHAKDAGNDGGDGPVLLLVVPNGTADLEAEGFGEVPADEIRRVAQTEVWSWMRGVEAMPATAVALIDAGRLAEATVVALARLGLSPREESLVALADLVDGADSAPDVATPDNQVFVDFRRKRRERETDQKAGPVNAGEILVVDFKLPPPGGAAPGRTGN